MTSEQRRAHNAQLKAIRESKRRADAKAREAKRLAERDRISAIRLKGTRLDEHGKAVKAAVGKKAIAKQRALQGKERKAAAMQAARELQKKIREQAENADRMQDSHEPGENLPQEPKEEGPLEGKVIGAIDTEKVQAVATYLADILTHLQAMGGSVYAARFDSSLDNEVASAHLDAALASQALVDAAYNGAADLLVSAITIFKKGRRK